MRVFSARAALLILCIAQSTAFADEIVEHYNVDRNYHYLSPDEFERMLFGLRSPRDEHRNQILLVEARKSENDYCHVSAKTAFARKIHARPTARALCLTH
jgi:hypothetical protein